MLYFDRIEVPDGINVNKTSASKGVTFFTILISQISV